MSETEKHHDLFICHTGLDEAYVADLVVELEKAGVRCWYYERDNCGSSIGSAVDKALDECGALLFVMTKNLREASPYIQNELNDYVRTRRTIIPLRVAMPDGWWPHGVRSLIGSFPVVDDDKGRGGNSVVAEVVRRIRPQTNGSLPGTNSASPDSRTKPGRLAENKQSDGEAPAGRRLRRHLRFGAINLAVAAAIGGLAILSTTKSRPADSEHEPSFDAGVPDVTDVGASSSEWEAGLRNAPGSFHHRDHICSYPKRGEWKIDPGYVRNGPADNPTFDWTPGWTCLDYEHVRAGEDPDKWIPDPGYVLSSMNSLAPFVKWQANLPYPDHPGKISTRDEGVWEFLVFDFDKMTEEDLVQAAHQFSKAAISDIREEAQRREAELAAATIRDRLSSKGDSPSSGVNEWLAEATQTARTQVDSPRDDAKRAGIALLLELSCAEPHQVKDRIVEIRDRYAPVGGGRTPNDSLICQEGNLGTLFARINQENVWSSWLFSNPDLSSESKGRIQDSIQELNELEHILEAAARASNDIDIEAVRKELNDLESAESASIGRCSAKYQ